MRHANDLYVFFEKYTTLFLEVSYPTPRIKLRSTYTNITHVKDNSTAVKEILQKNINKSKGASKSSLDLRSLLSLLT